MSDSITLHRVPTPTEYNPPDGSDVRIAAIFDCETTGLDPETDALLELGITLVEYSPFPGKLYRVLEEASWLQDPGRPIPLEITQLTGLTDDQVKGQMIPAALAESMIDRASIVIAHNAGFDRLFLENFSPVFASKPWGCLVADIDWKGEGIASTKLDFLLFKMGWYSDGHLAEWIDWADQKVSRANPLRHRVDGIFADVARINE